MNLKTEHLARCIETLEQSLGRLQQAKAGSIDYEIFRNATIKGYELSLETAGKLLHKALKAYAENPRMVDEWVYKDVLRHAAKHGLLEPAAVERWFAYRDNRNSTAHDYGAGFAEETLSLLPSFIEDARRVERSLHEKFSRHEP